MMRILRRTLPVATLLGPLVLAGTVTPVTAQAPAAEAPWASVTAGLRIGYDNNVNGELVGGQIRIPLLRDGSLEFVPSGDITFVPRLREYQGNLDVTWIPRGSGSSGAFVGGGLAFRNTIFGDPLTPRETRRGYNIVAGLKSGSRDSLIQSQLELRWTRIKDIAFNPQTVSFGVNLRLTNRPASR